MGRPKQPIDLVLLKGNKHLTKSEIEERKNSEVKAGADNIFAPKTLKSKKLKNRFNYLAEQLLNINIITNLDVESLARYVLLEDQYNKVTMVLNSLDLSDEDEILQYDKMLTRQTKIYNMLNKSASELGLTISSRCKLVVPQPKEQPKNKFEKFSSGSGTK